MLGRATRHPFPALAAHSIKRPEVHERIALLPTHPARIGIDCPAFCFEFHGDEGVCAANGRNIGWRAAPPTLQCDKYFLVINPLFSYCSENCAEVVGSFRWVTAKTSVIDAYMRRAMRFVIKAKGVLVEINLPSPIDLALAMVILEVLRRLK